VGHLVLGHEPSVERRLLVSHDDELSKQEPAVVFDRRVIYDKLIQVLTLFPANELVLVRARRLVVKLEHFMVVVLAILVY